MSKVFISYAHVDSVVADQLAAILDELNIEYFLDRKEINWGNSITSKVQSGLDQCSAILVIVSPASLKSHWVPYEIGQVTALRKIILPYLTHPSLEVPQYISSLNYVTTYENMKQYFTNHYAQELSDLLETQALKENEPSTAKSGSFNLSDMQTDYLMDISRPRNNGIISTGFLINSGRESAKYREALDLFDQYRLMDFDGSCYNLTSKGWELADQFWGLRILDSLELGEPMADSVLAKRVELTDGENELEELRRILAILEEDEFVRVSRTRGGDDVQILQKGITHRKHRKISI